MPEEKYQKIYRIPSARLSWHDYSGGIYFITICTAGKRHYFGEIPSGNGAPQMIFTDIGKCATMNLQNMTAHYPYVEIPLFVVMPNHIHAVVVINGDTVPHSRDVDLSRLRKQTVETEHGHGDTMNRVSTGGITGLRNPMLMDSLGTVVRGFKAHVTHFAREHNIEFAWQSRFHDHIVRDQDELNKIGNYMQNNVAKWKMDCFHN